MKKLFILSVSVALLAGLSSEAMALRVKLPKPPIKIPGLGGGGGGGGPIPSPVPLPLPSVPTPGNIPNPGDVIRDTLGGGSGGTIPGVPGVPGLPGVPGAPELPQIQFPDGKDLEKILADIRDKRVDGYKAACEVLTFGQIGRERDKERAQNQETLAQTKAEGAKKLREEKILNLEIHINLLKNAVADFEYLSNGLTQGSKDISSIAALAVDELRNRAALNEVVPQLKNQWDEDSVFIRDLLATVDELTSEVNEVKPEAAPTSVSEDVNKEADWKLRVNAKYALERLKNMAGTQEAEMRQRFARAFQLISFKEAEAIVIQLKEADAKAGKIAVYAQEKLRFYQNEKTSNEQQLKKLQDEK